MLRFVKTCLVMMVFRAVLALVLPPLVLALVLPPLVLAHESPRAMPSLDTSPIGEEAIFLKENEAAMSKMMSGMAAEATGDIDRDFVAMMVPHHQGAIDMAVIELRHGKNEQLRRIAQEIIVEQMQEIAAMKLAIGQPVTTTAPVPTQPDLAANAVGDRHHHMSMPPEGSQ